MLTLLIVLSIVVCVAIGWKTSINIGLLAMPFAYIFGCFVLGLPPSQVIKMWPVSTFYIIMTLSLFYNFAMINGTLEKIALNILYIFRKSPKLLPFCLFLAAAVMSALGPGYFTVMAFFPALTYMLCKKSGVDKITCLLAAHLGALGGSNFMTAYGGVIMRGIFEENGYTSQEAFSLTGFGFIVTCVVPIITILILMALSKNNINKQALLDMERPAPFDKKQKINIGLIFFMLASALIPPVLNLIFPGNATITFINSKIDMGLMCALLAVVAMLLDLGDKKEAFNRIPWNTLILISGVGMLIGVAKEAGMLVQLSGWLGAGLPKFLVPVAMCVVGGFMSFFSSGYGVVAPTLLPLIPGLAAATGLNPMVLFGATLIGFQSTTASPFSAGGSMMLSAAEESERDGLFMQLLIKGVVLVLAMAILTSLVLTFFVK